MWHQIHSGQFVIRGSYKSYSKSERVPTAHVLTAATHHLGMYVTIPYYVPIAANRIASIAIIYPLSDLWTKDRNKRVESLVGEGQFVVGSPIMSMLRRRGTTTRAWFLILLTKCGLWTFDGVFAGTNPYVEVHRGNTQS